MRKASPLVLALAALGCHGKSRPQAAPPAPAAADAGTPRPGPELARIHGKITDSRGQPLARVRVLALAVDGHGLALTDSAPDGSYVLAVPAGPVHLETRTPGRVARALDVTAPAEAATVALSAGLTITGAVHDSIGRPLAGALVAARRELGLAAVDAVLGKHRRAPALGEWRDAGLLSTRSQPDGSYRTVGLAQAFYRLGVEATGFAPVEVRQVLAPSEDMAVSLSREVVLAGRVVDPGGAPAAGAAVEVAGSGLWPPRVATTGKDGRFEVTGLVEGIYEARARLGSALASPPLEGIERFGDAAPDLILALAPARELSGSVLDFATGMPVGGAHVGLARDTLAALADREDADPQGAFQVPALPPGRYVASVSAPGYLPLWGAPVLVPPGSGPVVIDLRMSRGAALAGLVLDGAGAPVKGARIQVLAADASGSWVPVGETPPSWAGAQPDPAARFRPRGELGVLTGPIPYPPPRAASAPPSLAPAAGPPAAGVVSDAAGRFSIAGLPPGKARVLCSHPDFADTASADLTLAAAAAPTQVTLTLSPGAIVRGRVTDPGGVPLADVLVSERGGLAAAGSDSDDDLPAAAGPAPLIALTDADGRYQLGRLTGKLELEASRLHYATATQTLDISAAQAGQGAELTADFVLTPADRELAGSVVDGLGFALAGARVKVAGARGKKAVVTGADGRFVVPRLGLGPYHLEVSHPDYPSVKRELASPDDRVEIALAFGGGISGRVLDGRSRQPIEGALLRLSGPDGVRREVRPDPRGDYEVVALLPGPWTLTASAPGHAPAQRTLTLEAASRAPRDVTARDLDLELGEAARVSGRVVDEHGDPVTGAEVGLEQDGKPLAAPHSQSGADGGFVLSDVPEGDYDVVASYPGGRSTYRDLRVRGGDDRAEVVVTAR